MGSLSDSSLHEYASKREFGKTPEPGLEAAVRSGPLLFCVQKHDATRLHYDLRLELDGVLKSWALPKGLPFAYGDKHFAVQTEDHPIEYATFEGVIPKDQYGGGEMLIWDCGYYSPDEGGVFAYGDRDVAQARLRKEFEDGKISFYLRGAKIKGSFALVRMKDGGWLVLKHKDEFADPAKNPMDDEPSVISGLTLEDLRNGATSARPALARLVPSGKLQDFPGEMAPMFATLASTAFSGEGWMFEPKLDGYRTLAMINNGSVKLLSRRGHDTTAQYPELVRQLANPPSGTIILDGEIVAFGTDGKPSFHAMQSRAQIKGAHLLEAADRETPCVFYVFDLLYADGLDLRGEPLVDRKRWLRQAILPASRVVLVDYIEDDGETMFAVSQVTGLEGIIAKRADSRYEAGKRSRNWLKIKNTQTADFVVAGVSEGQGGRKSHFGALLLGYWQEGELVYAGHVGSGFDDNKLQSLSEKLARLTVNECPFQENPPLHGKTTWVRPEIVVEVKFHEWTPDGNLRAPVFLREREDVEPASVSMVKVVETGKSVERFTGGMSEQDILDVVQQLDNTRADLVIEVGAEQLPVTNLNKVYWPEDGITKRDLLRYLAKVSRWMIRHTIDKPITMIRFPEGIHGEQFFQKHWDAGKPDFVETIRLFSGTKGLNHEYVACNNLPTLLWLAQLGTLEFHVPHMRAAQYPDGLGLPMDFTDSETALDRSILSYPDHLTFDIDPYIYSGEEVEGAEPEFNVPAFEAGKEVAFWLKELLDSLGLSSFVKTSGKTGLHIFAPIIRNMTFEEVRAICETLSTTLMLAHPKEITTEWSTKKRTGKIFMDYNMNIRGKTLNSAYSPRALPGGVVSMPVTWEELKTVHPHDFTMFNAIDRLMEKGDAWATILEPKTDLSKLLG